MNNMDNLHSYDNVEYVQGHELSDEELRRYCDSKMESARSNVEFIEKVILEGGGGQNAAIDVCEIGGGNGKLLYSLEKRGILRNGINYEVSRSRCELAEKFAKLLSCEKVENKNLNFLEDTTKENVFDCIIMVDIVWQLIAPLYDSAENDMLQWIKKALKKGGYLFLELEDDTHIIDQVKMEKILRIWEEFPEADPFQYSLKKITIDSDNNIVNEKYFIGRNNNKRDYFKNVIRPYTQEEIANILKNDFDVSIHQLPLSERTENNEYRVLAKKIR